MKINDLTWMIGGEAGFGIQSAGHIFALAASRGGLHVFGTAEYPSLIRGGHNSDVIRVSDREVFVHKEQLDLLLAMNKETLDLHVKEVVPGGGVIFDGEVIKDYKFQIPNSNERNDQSGGVKVFSVPLKKMAIEFGKSDITRNTVGIGASYGLLGYDVEIFYEILREMFARKGEQVVTNNLAAARAGYNYVREHYSKEFDYKLTRVEGQPRRMLLTGSDALCLGALKAGCKFVAEYPMTPSSSILHFMAAQAKNYNVIVKHTEDEIAAMNMVVGAGWAGVRAMTGTSGGGFSLMVEALGLAGMCEVPIVCVNVQRPGPSTGLPTRTEQSDLQFTLHASQGEFPRIVIAPGDFEECFYLTFDAFNLAEKYQTPVLILSDKHLAESVKTVEPFKTDGLKIDRGKFLSQAELDDLRKKSTAVVEKIKKDQMKNVPASGIDPNSGANAKIPSSVIASEMLGIYGIGSPAAEDNFLSVDNGFLRYKFTEDGISYRVRPGMKGGIHRSSSDEHDESGDLIEIPENRNMMMEKRARKLVECLKELPAPKLIGAKRKIIIDGSLKNAEGIIVNLDNAARADVTFVTWGSPKDALSEVMEMLEKDGVRAQMLQIVYMSPFHAREIGEILRTCKFTVGVEMNSEAQMCALITEKTGYFVDGKILKYTGRQFTAHEIYDRAKGLLGNYKITAKCQR